jgi:TPR repeat protein
MKKVLLTLLLLLLAVAGSAGLFDIGESDQHKLESGLEALEQMNYSGAFLHWKDLADKGNPEAQYHIGWLYANGNGVSVDVPVAMSWWKKAALQNHAPSAFSLGMLYMTGDGKSVKKNVPEAIKWHMKAAENGSQDGREMMRQLYKTRKRAVLKQFPDITEKPWFKVEKSAK